MYSVYCDGILLYSSILDELQLQYMKIEMELNKTGSFSFTIYQDHVAYNLINKLKSIITVYQDDSLLFKGRVLDDEIGFHNEKQVICEGELAFLLDSIQRPYDYSGSLSGYFTQLINNHNAQVESSKQFTVGNVTVQQGTASFSRKETEYMNTWDSIQNKLIETHGGYIVIRHQNNVNYIDYLSDFNVISSQKITFGKNLIDMKLKRSGEEIATAVIPLGAKLEGTDERLTIKSVNNNVDYVYNQTAVTSYGWIFKTVIFDDISSASDLKTKGLEYLSQQVSIVNSLELSAADLASIDQNVNSFRIGTYVRVTTEPHSIDQNFLVDKISVDLLNPANNKLTLGTRFLTLTEKQNSIKFIKGEKGDPGSDGADGSPGRDGTNGTNGRDGIDGQDGQDGKDAAIQSMTAPSDHSYMWLDISVDPALLKRWNGTAWEALNDTSGIEQEITLLEQDLRSEISQTQTSILSTVSANYYLKGQTDALVSAVSTELEQTADAFEIRFNTFDADLEDLASNTDAEFTEIHQYIRFVDGNIILGESNNPLTLKIENDQIAFYDSNHKVAYFTNDTLFVNDGVFVNTLRLGCYAFIPRPDGHLSFGKVC